MKSEVFPQFFPTIRIFSTLWIIRILLPFFFLLSYTLSLNATALTFILPGGLTYTIEGDITQTKKLAFRYVQEQREDHSTEIAFTHSQGYAQYLAGETRIPTGAIGDLLIAIFVKHDQDFGSPLELGVKWQQESKIESDVITAETILTTNTITAIEETSVEAEASLSSRAENVNFCGQIQNHSPATLQTDASPHYLTWLRIPGIPYGSFDPMKTKVMLQGKEYTLQQRESGNPPDRDTVVILHFIPHKISSQHLTIYGSTPEAQSARQGSRELQESDLNKLSTLITPDIAVRIARRFQIEEADIGNLKSTYLAQGAELNFQLLKTILDSKGDKFTSEALAEKMEEEHLGTLAERVRKNQLEVSADDADFQQEMITLSTYIAPFVEELALAMGFPPTSTSAFTESNQPGYELLYKAYQEQRLGMLYEASKKSELGDLPHQVKDSTVYPILASRIQEQQKPKLKQSKNARLLPVVFNHLDPYLLDLRMTGRDLMRLGRPPNERRQKNFIQMLEQVQGAMSFSLGSGMAITSADNALFSVKQREFGTGLSYRKWLAILNDIDDLETHSVAQRTVEYLENPEEHQIISDSALLALAQKYSKTNRPLSLRFLLARAKPGSHGSRIEKYLGHNLGIQCEEYDCKDAYGRRKCGNSPSLEVERQRLALTPYQFYPSKKT